MDYIHAIIVNPDLPLEAKTLALKLYGVSPEHIKLALNSTSPELRQCIFGHKHFNEGFVNELEPNQRYSVLGEMLDGGMAPSKHFLINAYKDIFNLCESDPDSYKHLLFKIHASPDFESMDHKDFDEVRQMALSPFGSSIGIDQFVVDPAPQNGLAKNVDSYKNAMEFLHGPGELKNIKDSENDHRSVALQSYGYANSNTNRRILDIVADLAKPAQQRRASQPIKGEYRVSPKAPVDESCAVIVQKCFHNGSVSKAHFVGKHIGGSLVAEDAETGIAYLLKTDDSKDSPAAGVEQEKASQNQREFAFVHMAKFMGLEDFFPDVHIIYINSKEYAAISLMENNFDPAADMYDDDSRKVIDIFEKYRVDGTLLKMSILDYVLGNPDRHGHNILLNLDFNRMLMIDHGSAFAGVSFSPGLDPNSFVPYYLRYRNSREFAQMDMSQKLAVMPVTNPTIERQVMEWVKSIDSAKFEAHLRALGIMPKPSVMRLETVKQLPGSLSAAMNCLWLK